MENNERLEQKKRELKVKVQAELMELKERGIEGYDGWVGVTETVQQAYDRRVKSSEWILKMLEGNE